MIRTLDRYVLRGFLYSYLLCFVILMGMRIISDLFINMDEFAEADLPWLEMVQYVGGYYLYNSLVYFRELGGIILAAAAAFSLARMNHTNELTAILASGVSLHRVLWPVVLLGVLLSGLSVINQEVLIPGAKDKLVRDRDDVPGTQTFPVSLPSDSDRNVWFSKQFSLAENAMIHPMVIARDSESREAAKFAGVRAVYVGDGAWRINGAIAAFVEEDGMTTGTTAGMTAGQISTQLGPDYLAAAKPIDQDGRPVIVARDGRLRIVVAKSDIRNGTLHNPTFEILDEKRPQAGRTPRVMARFQAKRAHHGVFNKNSREMGYYLDGDAELRADQVHSWPNLCRQLAKPHRWAKADWPGKRIMAELPTALRETVEQVADESRRSLPRADRTQLLKSLNEIIDTRDFCLPTDFPIGSLHKWDVNILLQPRADLSNEQYRRLNRRAMDIHLSKAIVASAGELWITTDLTPAELCLRQDAKWLQFMSTSELGTLLQSGKAPDPLEARLIKHSRFTQPLINLTLLLIGIPFILSRERNIKASASLCVALVTLSYLSVFVARYLGVYGLNPILAAWLPVLVFVPLSIALLDTVKT